MLPSPKILARIGSEITVRIVRTTATPAEIDIYPNHMKTLTIFAKMQMSMISVMKMKIYLTQTHCNSSPRRQLTISFVFTVWTIRNGIASEYI